MSIPPQGAQQRPATDLDHERRRLADALCRLLAGYARAVAEHDPTVVDIDAAEIGGEGRDRHAGA